MAWPQRRMKHISTDARRGQRIDAIWFPARKYAALRTGEGVLMEPHNRAAARRRFDRQNVKAARRFVNAARGEKLARDAAEYAAFLGRNGFFGHARAAAAHFHFDERENARVIADQIDFA